MGLEEEKTRGCIIFDNLVIYNVMSLLTMSYRFGTA